ncbi:MAG: chorismate mutase [Acutalibacteraceae bacterium]|nr:chorismate mutase [Acutalibacteraceae bacterium]
MDKLSKARQEINRIDKEMAELFCQRMEAVKTVAEYKKERGLPILDSTREEEVIKNNSAFVKDEEIRAYYINFLRNNMAISRNFQNKLNSGIRVAFAGVQGAFAQVAAKKIFDCCQAVPYDSFKNAYDAAVNGECDCVLLPIENSYNGDVGQVMDIAFFGSLYVSGVYDIGITHHLVAKKGADIKNIKEVISHSQALGQCEGFIKKHGFITTESTNTAVAAQWVSKSDRGDIAAIASEEAARIYGLEIIESCINDSNSNTTRFAVFSPVKKNESLKDKQFIMLFTVKNESGCLGKALSVIGENGFNLRALKSRPTKELIWDYYFYAEGEGNINSPEGEKMLKALEPLCSHIKILGSFEKEISL